MTAGEARATAELRVPYRTVPCGAVDPIRNGECINVKPLGATACAGPHRFRDRCHSGCVLDWPHHGEACLVERHR